MRCTTCGAATQVQETRPLLGGVELRRARVCPEGHRFYTREVVEEGPPAPGELPERVDRVRGTGRRQRPAQPAPREPRPEPLPDDIDAAVYESFEDRKARLRAAREAAAAK